MDGSLKRELPKLRSSELQFQLCRSPKVPQFGQCALFFPGHTAQIGAPRGAVHTVRLTHTEPWQPTLLHELYSRYELPPDSVPCTGTHLIRMKLQVSQFMMYICPGLEWPCTPWASWPDLSVVSATKTILRLAHTLLFVRNARFFREFELG